MSAARPNRNTHLNGPAKSALIHARAAFARPLLFVKQI
jgi:hypothetical protein